MLQGKSQLSSLWFCYLHTHDLIFVVIGYNTIDIPEIFQVFTVWCKVWFYIAQLMETLWEYPEGEGSTRQRVIRGRITPYPFIYNLWQKWYPCVICIICKWHPFYILIWNLSSWRSSASEILSGFHIPTAWKRQLCRSRSEGLSWLFAENNDKSFFQLFQFLFGVRVRHHCWLLFQAAATWPKKGNPFGWSLPV